jgi:hypothetical protein
MAYLAPAAACGPMLCVRTARDVAVLDPSSGNVAWRHGPLANMTYGPGVLVADDPADPAHLRVVHWRTGRVVRQPAGWTVVRAFDDSPPATMALVRRLDGESTVLGAVDLRSGDLHVLGVVSVRPTRCVLGIGRLACIAESGPTRLWRLPTASA